MATEAPNTPVIAPGTPAAPTPEAPAKPKTWADTWKDPPKAPETTGAHAAGAAAPAAATPPEGAKPAEQPGKTDPPPEKAPPTVGELAKLSRQLGEATKAKETAEGALKEHQARAGKALPVLEALEKGDIAAALKAWDPDWAKKHDFVELTAKLSNEYGDPNAPVTVAELERREAARRAEEQKRADDAKKADDDRKKAENDAKAAKTAEQRQTYMNECGKVFEAVPAAERAAKWPTVFEFDKRQGVDLFAPDIIDQVVKQHYQQMHTSIAPAAALDAIEAHYAGLFPELAKKAAPAAPAEPAPVTVSSRWNQGAPPVGAPPPEAPRRKTWAEVWDEDIKEAAARDRNGRAA